MSAPVEHPRSLGRFATRIVWSVLGLAGAYVLSGGPVGVILLRFCLVRSEDPPAVAAKREACVKAIEAFYSPLRAIVKASKTEPSSAAALDSLSLRAIVKASKTEPLFMHYWGWWCYTFQPEGGYRQGGGRLIFSSPASFKDVPDLPPSAPASSSFVPDPPPFTPATRPPQPEPATP